MIKIEDQSPSPMTAEEKAIVVEYLKSMDIKTMEFFEELNDHIITSFEHREDRGQTIKAHIREEIEPGFGGVMAIKRIKSQQEKARQKMINQRFLELLKHYLFGWPSVIITISFVVLIALANRIFEPKYVLGALMVIGGLGPAVVCLIANYRFWCSCRLQGKPYRNSDLNNRVLTLSLFGTNAVNILLNFVGFFIVGSQAAAMSLYASQPVAQIALGTWFALYSLVCIRIYKEKFTVKLETV